MRQVGEAGLIAAVLLVAGCFQAEAPRPVARPANDAATDVETQRLTVMKADADEDPPAVPEPALLLREGRDPASRREAVYAIADAEEPNDAALIGEALYDPDAGVRLAAIESLTGTRSDFSSDWLSIALGDPDPQVRRTAVEALGEIDDDDTGFLLQQALADVDEGVREAAQQMLEEQAPAPGELSQSSP